MDVRLPDGTIIQGVPDGTTKADLVAKLQSKGMAVPAEWLNAVPTEKPSRGVSGMAGDLLAGAVRGAGSIGATLLTPIDAAARAVGIQNDYIGRTDRRQAMTDALSGMGADTDSGAFRIGQLGGEVAGTAGLPGAAVARLRAVAPVLSAAPKAANLLRAVETGGAAGGNIPTRVAGGALAGGAQAAAVDPESAAGGAIGGGIGGPLIGALASRVAPVAARGYEALRGAIGRPLPGSSAALQQEARAALEAGGTPSAAVDERISQALQRLHAETGSKPVLSGDALDSLRNEITTALAAGRELDTVALARRAVAGTVLSESGRMTAGQATRNPMQFAQELNLRGIQGVGEPMQARMAAQNADLISAVRGSGALPDAYEAGSIAIPALRKLDQSKAAEVSQAYRAFRESGGAAADIPMSGLVDQYGKTLADFGVENIPSAVRGRIESYLSRNLSRQTKVFDLDAANQLLTQINAHYDPTKPAQQAALGRIKDALRQSIDAADTGEGGDLLQAAIGKARERFALHDAVPALKDAAVDSMPAQERFLREYVTGPGASVDSVGKMMSLLDPAGAEAVRGAVRRQLLSAAAPGAEYGRETATISQAALRRAIDQIGPRKLAAIMGADEAGKLATVQQVAEWLQKAPPGAAVNSSNTAGAVANLLQRIPGGGVPGLVLQKGRELLQESANRGAVRNALAGAAPSTPIATSPEATAAAQRIINALAPRAAVLTGPLAGQTEPTSSRRRQNALAR